jgi:AbrB family looped-hinge helix DNA binding protein
MEAQMPREKGLSEEPQTFEAPVTANASVGRARLRIGDGGRIVIPAEMRAAMLVKPGDTVTAEVVDGEFRIVSPKVAVRKVQALAQKYKKPGVSVVDELIAERHAESAREEEEARVWREQHDLAGRNRK